MRIHPDASVRVLIEDQLGSGVVKEAVVIDRQQWAETLKLFLILCVKPVAVHDEPVRARGAPDLKSIACIFGAAWNAFNPSDADPRRSKQIIQCRSRFRQRKNYFAARVSPAL